MEAAHRAFHGLAGAGGPSSNAALGGSRAQLAGEEIKFGYCGDLALIAIIRSFLLLAPFFGRLSAKTRSQRTDSTDRPI